MYSFFTGLILSLFLGGITLYDLFFSGGVHVYQMETSLVPETRSVRFAYPFVSYILGLAGFHSFMLSSTFLPEEKQLIIAFMFSLTLCIGFMSMIQDAFTLNIDRHLLRLGMLSNYVLAIGGIIKEIKAQNALSSLEPSFSTDLSQGKFSLIFLGVLTVMYFLTFVFFTDIGASDFRLLWLFLPLGIYALPQNRFTLFIITHLFILALYHYVMQHFIYHDTKRPVALAPALCPSGIILFLLCLLV